MKHIRLCDWQYIIKCNDVSCFKSGEMVFLKSNPECPMIVLSVNEYDITTMWYNVHKEQQFCDFLPECILQYKYAGLLTYQGRFQVCLN